MKIEGSNNIKDIFSIFHDGCIINCHLEENALVMEVEIEYLAERINPHFRKFTVRLAEIQKLRFSTWLNDLESEPLVLTKFDSIFKPELEIAQGNVVEGQIQIICLQSDPEFEYCGGELYFTAVSAEVFDEAGKFYSVGELVTLANAYWKEWSEKTR